MPIAGCPGRWRLRGPADRRDPAALVGAEARALQRARSGAAPDEVLVLPLEDGGLISFRRADGTHVHTLGDRAGFARKLEQLGLVLLAGRGRGHTPA